ncbi:MAG TPA: substrate-binding domain-containing protein [Solirubrobacteraceae bacterium]|nr:substrate-binding domain-containing protein [Solirubrobacteraceae bacterium]
MRVKARIVIAGVIGLALVGTFFATASGAATKKPAKVTYKNLSFKDFTLNYSAMKALKPLAAKGTGSVAVILPDTTSSTRYTEFDAPMLKTALTDAGLKSSQINIQNAGGSDSTFITDVQADITNGAKVIGIDPEDSATGVKAEQLAAAAGVKTIDYDRLTLGGATSGKYYVSFNNVNVGKLLGKGLVACVKAWKVSSPKVIVMRGDPTDNNATLFANGYFDILNPYFNNKGWTDLAQPAGTWTPATAETEFQQAFTANPTANALLSPNDENAAPIITYLKQQGVKPDTFPVTGQDATLVGLQNIISGYQCGTVYKPVFLEAQAAAALAMYLRAGKTPPKALINSTTEDTVNNIAVPSILETPEWVTGATMEKTIVHDKFVPASQICSGFTAACKKYGIH